MKTLFSFLQNKEEVKCTEPSPSISIPWSYDHYFDMGGAREH